MTRKDGRDYLFLIWKNPKLKQNKVVGVLSKNGKYEFKYANDIDELEKNGFELLIAFPDKSKVYESEKLFPVFSSRLPDPKRQDIKDILKRYGLKDYDAYELLKASGARLPIDSFEFINPIFTWEDGKVIRKFFVSGTGFNLPCSGAKEHCRVGVKVIDREALRLRAEPENPIDKNAVAIYDNANSKLGYVPAYYAKQVKHMLDEGKKYICKIIKFDTTGKCTECIKVDMTFLEAN